MQANLQLYQKLWRTSMGKKLNKKEAISTQFLKAPQNPKHHHSSPNFNQRNRRWDRLTKAIKVKIVQKHKIRAELSILSISNLYQGVAVEVQSSKMFKCQLFLHLFRSLNRYSRQYFRTQSKHLPRWFREWKVQQTLSKEIVLSRNQATLQTLQRLEMLHRLLRCRFENYQHLKFQVTRFLPLFKAKIFRLILSKLPF